MHSNTNMHTASPCNTAQKPLQLLVPPPETIQSHDSFHIWGNWPLNIRSFRKIPYNSLGILWFKKQSNQRIASPSQGNLLSMCNVFTRYFLNHLEISNSQNNPITRYLPNRRELFQSQLGPFTRYLPNHWENFNSRSNPITGYLPHPRGTFQTIFDSFASKP